MYKAEIQKAGRRNGVGRMDWYAFIRRDKYVMTLRYGSNSKEKQASQETIAELKGFGRVVPHVDKH